MKITKQQIQKIIKEELEALEESRHGGPGSLDQAPFDPGFGNRLDPEKRQKERDQEKLDIIRKADAGRRDKDELASMAKADAESAADVDDQIAFRNTIVNMMKNRIKFRSGLPSLVGQAHLKAAQGKTMSDFEYKEFKNSLNRELKTAIRSHSRAAESGADGVLKTLEKKLAKAAPDDSWKELPNYKAAKEAFAKPAGYAKSQGLGSKIKSFFGMNEDLILTAEELDRIIEEEIQNITKGN